jgi:hypothetical protein
VENFRFSTLALGVKEKGAQIGEWKGKNNEHPTTNNEHPTSNNEHPTSNNQQPKSRNARLTQFMIHT